MDIVGNRLMASSIESVTENMREQTVTFRIMFPYDFGENLYDERVIIFSDVIYYSVDEIIIPKGRVPQISFISDLGEIKKYKKFGPNGQLKEIVRSRYEIQTNLGTRTIEFKNYSFFKIEEKEQSQN